MKVDALKHKINLRKPLKVIRIMGVNLRITDGVFFFKRLTPMKMKLDINVNEKTQQLMENMRLDHIDAIPAISEAVQECLTDIVSDIFCITEVKYESIN